MNTDLDNLAMLENILNLQEYKNVVAPTFAAGTKNDD